MYQEIINFWFEEITPDVWWVSDPAFDETIKSRFLGLMQQAARCELYEWRAEPQGRLAEIIILDQFSRNVYRNTAQAFSQDAVALVLAQEAVLHQAHTTLTPDERNFLLMPYMHSESKKIHVSAEKLYRDFAPTNNYEFELKHKAVIDRFGRYPSRNAILGRQSTPEEIAFMQEHGAGF